MAGISQDEIALKARLAQSTLRKRRKRCQRAHPYKKGAVVEFQNVPFFSSPFFSWIILKFYSPTDGR